ARSDKWKCRDVAGQSKLYDYVGAVGTFGGCIRRKESKRRKRCYDVSPDCSHLRPLYLSIIDLHSKFGVISITQARNASSFFHTMPAARNVLTPSAFFRLRGNREFESGSLQCRASSELVRNPRAEQRAARSHLPPPLRFQAWCVM